MNLSKRLPLTISAACFSALLMMSSCSKEDSQIPQPEVTNLKESSAMRGGGVLSAFHLPSTDGQTCIGCVPQGWGATGYATSNLQCLGGDPAKPWVKPLPTPSTGAGSIFTVTSDLNGQSNGLGYQKEFYSNIKNLIPGKKYKVTFSVSTSSQIHLGGVQSPYAASASVKLYLDTSSSSEDVEVEKEVSLRGIPGQWVTESITFIAKRSTAGFRFYSTPSSTDVTYANIHVPNGAVEVVQ